MLRPGGLLADLWRYGLALVGPVGVAGGQFVLMLVLLHRIGETGFGRFAFLTVLAQFALAISSSLFGALLARIYAAGEIEHDERLLDGVFAMNGLVVAASLPAGVAVALSLGERAPGALLFGAFIAAGLMRWYGRAFAYAQLRQLSVVGSDLAYAGVLIGGAGLAWWLPAAPAALPYAVLAGAAVTGLLPFGAALARLFAWPRATALRAYRDVWRRYSSWALLGVVTTEAAANAQSYLVTLFLGPTAFAPIAASGLLLRPVAVATNAFSEYERNRFARAFAEGDAARLRASLRFFRQILALCWVVTALIAAVVLLVDPYLLYPRAYPVEAITLGVVLWTVMAAVRMWRAPEAIALQAAGVFRPLAFVSVWAAPVSIVCVCVALLVAPPIWSLLGVIAGEFASAMLLWAAARRWLYPAFRA